MAVGQNLTVFQLSAADLKFVTMGLKDAVAGQGSRVDLPLYGPKIREFEHARKMAQVEKEKKKSKAFLDKAAKEPGAKVMPSGLVFTEVRAGAGQAPVSTETIKAHYRGALADGTEFDSSYKRGAPTQFALNGVIRCWTEGIQKMRVGGQAKLICPSDIGYGDGGNPPNIPGGAALVFDVELVEIVKK
ncbi:MAG: FKBP-type peptidylprolyl cis-trans isomerase [Elusimicrobia bacterium]|nr:MAG: FKBP-type peptidylprolyl cis-trans isomerase [Elusimicrobiota bacterium]